MGWKRSIELLAELVTYTSAKIEVEKKYLKFSSRFFIEIIVKFVAKG